MFSDSLNKTIFGNDLMTNDLGPEEITISKLTWLLLVDSGLYSIHDKTYFD